MPKILLTPEILMERASQVKSCQQEQQNIIEQVGKLVRDLVNGWEGEAQRAFQGEFERRKGTYTQFAPDLEKFSAFLTSYADTMKSIDSGKANEANNITES